MNEKVTDITLSLIIPCHELENYIQPCLNSIVNQTNSLKVVREAIFICDNCTDTTQQIIENTMKNSSWNYQILEAHEGSPGGARNIGLNAAKGKYIWFIDGDDWIVENNAIDILLDHITKNDMDIVEFKIKSVANPSGIFGRGTVWRAMFSKRIIGDRRFNNEQVGEDNDFVNKIWGDPKVKYGSIALGLYFYNFPRKGSQLAKKWNIKFD